MAKRWEPFLDNDDAFEFLAKIGSAIAGAEVSVHQGGSPQVRRLAPKDYFCDILLPKNWFCQGNVNLLQGGLNHELCHVMASDYKPLVGIEWALFQLSNALEDRRIEFQVEKRWPGLVRPIRDLLHTVLEFRKRQRGIAYSAETLKVWEVSVALYLVLSQIERSQITATAPEMAVAIAEELHPMAAKVVELKNTAEVVELARRLAAEINRAAEKVAQRTGSRSAYAYAHSLRTELAKAMAETVEEVFARLSRESQSENWLGPWFKGSGGLTFYPINWDLDNEAWDLLAIPNYRELMRYFAEADPLIEYQRRLPQQLNGKLMRHSRSLVQAAIGAKRRVFEKTEYTRRFCLQHILGMAEFALLLEAHEKYTPVQWTLLKSAIASFARLLSEFQVPFMFRAWTATRVDIEEEFVDAKTQKKQKRFRHEYYVNIATIKNHHETWSQTEEDKLVSLPKLGFLNPLEGYEKCLNWGITHPKNKKTRINVCFGNAGAQDWNPGGALNVRSGNLSHATACLRRNGQGAVYVHFGQAISRHSKLYTEVSAQFDELVQADSVKSAVIGLLQAVLFHIARRK